tara:strand:+ start:99 stop:503 length:405 start_codon:yes stop_codon:yes gene_type:complete
MDQNDKQEDIVSTIRKIQDPEIPVNLYDLGLIREIKIKENNSVEILMTLTNPNCPVADVLPEQVRLKTEEIRWVNSCRINLTWEPPWTPKDILEEGKMILEVLGLEHVLISGTGVLPKRTGITIKGSSRVNKKT